MGYYPLNVRLTDKHCLVVGAGAVGRRKIASLLAADPAGLLVLDAAPPDAELTDLLRHPAASFAQRPFAASDLDGRFLVVAATADRAVNAAVALACRERGVLCNVVDAPDEGDFIVPAQAACGDLSVCISTGGHSPALARKIRQDLQGYLGLRYERLLALLGRLRPLLLGLGLPSAENTAVFRAVVDSPLAETLRAGDREGSLTVLRELVPPALHPALETVVEEVLHGNA